MSDELVGTEEARIRAAVDAALRRVRVPEQRWATVQTWEPLSGQATAVVDGDDSAVPIGNATNASLSAGQRVLVLFTPPSGATIIGTRPGVPIVYTPELTGITLSDGSSLGWWSMAGGWIDLAVKITLGAAGDVTAPIFVGLPVPCTTVLTADPLLALARATIGGNRFVGAGVFQPATDPNAVGTFAGTEGQWTTTVPADWGPGDVLRVQARYPARLPNETAI